jgi:phage tail-like protein
MASWLEKKLYPEGMEVTVGTVPTPAVPSSLTSPGPGYQPDQNREIIGLRFEVLIDGHDLGFWTKVDGLSVKFEIAEYRAGNGNNLRWIEPAYTTFQNVKLGRVTTLKYTQRIMDWLQQTSFTSQKVTATVIGYPAWHDQAGQDFVVKWDLTGVLPVAWSGPQFDATTGRLATETLELAHEGFLHPDA